MVTTTHVALLLLGLTIICSAAARDVDTIGPFSKAVLMGRGLATQRRGFYNNDCSVEKCWDAFYLDAFTDVPSCNTALDVLKTCVNSGVTSQDVCTCNFDQVKTGMANIDDKMCATLHNTNFGKCADAKAQACVDKMNKVNEMMMSHAAVSAEDKKSLTGELNECVGEVMEGGVSTEGCAYMFPRSEDDPIAAINMVATHGWAVGCDEFNRIAPLCPAPLAETAEHCSDENDVVADFEECAKKQLPSDVCQRFLSEAAVMLNEVKDAACTNILRVQTTITATCGAQGRKRMLLKRLLKLLS